MIETLFGSGNDLSSLQMAARAFVLFFLTLFLVRVAGMRAFGRKSAFDAIIVIMLGAVLSRVVIGASAAIPTVTASAVFVVLHRLVAMVTARVGVLEKILKGSTRPLYRDGVIDTVAMNRHGISRADLEQAVRTHARCHHLHDVREIHFESSGELTVLDDVSIDEAHAPVARR